MVAGINCLMRNQSTSGRLFRNHRNLQVLRALSLEDKNFYNPNLTQIEATQLGISTLFWFEEYSFLLLDSLDQFKLLKTFPTKAALNPKKAEKDLFTSLEKEIKKKGFDNLRTFVKAKAKSLAWSELYSKDPKLTLKEFSLIRQVELPKFDIDNTMSGLVEHVDILELPEKLASRSDIEVIKYTRELGMLSIPGAFTPSEIMTAYNAGADYVKLFPITKDDIGYLKNIAAPISHVPFICTGGVNPDTIELFLNNGAVALGTGASILKKELIENEDYAEITRLTKLHLDKIKEVSAN
jgi:hypothetical protein